MQVDSRRGSLDAGAAGDAIPDRLPVWAGVLIGLTLVMAVALRFASHSHLWLDEALTVNISRLPLRDLPDALRHDGAPPMYYALLHLWMSGFGDGDVAVRALSGAIGVATLPIAYFAGFRLGGGDPVRGRWVAWSVVLLVATSPFAIRYSGETRMYSLTIALVFLGYLAVMRALERASLGRLACVTGVTAALLLTHYWSFFLLAVVGVILTPVAVGGPEGIRMPARRVLLALAAGGICFLPWLSVLLSQLRHTGTPWASPTISPSIVGSTFSQFAGGRLIVGRLLLVVLALLAVGAVLVRTSARDVHGGRALAAVRWVAVVGAATLLVGLALSYIDGSTYQVRYASVVFPFVVMVAAFGVTVLTSPAVRVGVLAVVVALGLFGGWRAMRQERTQAGRVASAIAAGAQRHDVVAYCPDQLGPSVTRELPRSLRVRQSSFPMSSTPERVDWVDYAEKVGNANPEQFAGRLLERAGAHTIWLVWSAGYRPFDVKCERIAAALGTGRGPGHAVVDADAGIFEHMGVVRFDP
jgi:mannosyltransferase